MPDNYSLQPYMDVGKHIERLIHRLAEKGGGVGKVMDYLSEKVSVSSSTLYRWRQGYLRPGPEKLERLARVGKEEAKLEREWGESLLNAANHQDVAAVVDRIWGGRVLRVIPNNLPNLKHTTLVGRDNEIARLLTFLSYERGINFISVEGIGGVGKTALVLEVAYRCWDVSRSKVSNPDIPTFDAIIFVSAKQQSLFLPNIEPSYRLPHRTLREIYHEVARVLESFDITRSPDEEDQRRKVLAALRRQHTLLIVDNLETMEKQGDVVSFLIEELPPTVKTITTSREQATYYSPLHLKALEERDALNLIAYLAKQHEVAERVTEEHARSLYNRIGGIPAAFVLAIGQIAIGEPVETVVDRVPKPESDVPRFLFAPSFQLLREHGQQAHHLLMAMAMFPKRPLGEAVAHTVGIINRKTKEAGFQLLLKLNLVTVDNDRYSMLPLTREYTLDELVAYPEFEKEARERWIGWHLKFAEKHGGHDWKDWHIQYDHLQGEWENFLAVFEWCARNDRYDEIRIFWQTRSKVSVLEFTDTYGYWDDCLFWLDWLVHAAQQRGDRETAVEAMGNAGFILTLMGRLEDAKEQFRRAWDIAGETDPAVQLYLTIDNAFLHIGREDYAAAQDQLDLAMALLDTTQLSKEEYDRMWTNIKYDFGVLYFSKKNYGQAAKHFRQAIERAKAIDWERVTISAQSYLADIAINQGQLNGIESLLQEGLKGSTRNKEKRRTAFYMRSFAYLYEKQRNGERARDWAQQAHEHFVKLDMQREVEEMHELLQRLQVQGF